MDIFQGPACLSPGLYNRRLTPDCTPPVAKDHPGVCLALRPRQASKKQEQTFSSDEDGIANAWRADIPRNMHYHE
jgi:hypothetical protein